MKKTMKKENAQLMYAPVMRSIPNYEPSVEEILHNLVCDLSDINCKINRAKPLNLNSDIQNDLYEEEKNILNVLRTIICRRICDLVININKKGESDMACGTKVKGGKKKPTKKK